MGSMCCHSLWELFPGLTILTILL
uniref:Uncharacterized protein n=1 Tax=Rhizophora mucronata TaxID=61149 RepID=A0A2P2P527_RHIMU